MVSRSLIGSRTAHQIVLPRHRWISSIAFQNVKRELPDSMQELKKATDADCSPDKVDIGAGVYRNEEGRYHEFATVRKAKHILDDLNIGHDYNATTGISSFIQNAARLIFGVESQALADARNASVQTIGGTGANRIGAAFLKRNLLDSSGTTPDVYLGEPAWGNYRPLLQNAGFKVRTYIHSHRGSVSPEFEAVLVTAKKAVPGSIFVLQASCHNPTGLDYDRSQWETLANVMLERGHFAFFDAAYVGFGGANADATETDAWAVRHFASRKVNMLVCQSFSKIFGLYSERVGALHVVCQSREIAENVFDQLRAQTRWEISSAPAYGARLVDIILSDKRLREEWLEELRVAAGRIVENRRAFYALATGDTDQAKQWEHILRERGLFSLTQLEHLQIELLAKQHHVYLPPNGRINVAGFSKANMKYTVAAFQAVSRET